MYFLEEYKNYNNKKQKSKDCIGEFQIQIIVMPLGMSI
jgi:hypothetical protein